MITNQKCQLYRKLPSDYALISDSFHFQLPYEVMKQYLHKAMLLRSVAKRAIANGKLLQM